MYFKTSYDYNQEIRQSYIDKVQWMKQYQDEKYKQINDVYKQQVKVSPQIKDENDFKEGLYTIIVYDLETKKSHTVRTIFKHYEELDCSRWYRCYKLFDIIQNNIKIQEYNTGVFECDECNFKTNTRNRYHAHLNTQKHYNALYA